MEENSFWLAVWKIVAWAIVGVSAVIGGCTAYESTLVAQMTERGADPVLARCAIGSQDSAFKVLCAARK